MSTNRWRYMLRFSLLGLLAVLLVYTGNFAARTQKTRAAAQGSDIQVIQASYVGVTHPLSSLTSIPPDPNVANLDQIMLDRLVMPKAQIASEGGSDTSFLQDSFSGIDMPTPVANFDGINNLFGVLPPDTQGDVGNDPATGKKYYIQWVNLAFEIWDVTNPAAPISVLGPFAGNTFWSGTGTLCESHNDGDPITLFDHLANRWFMSQFAVNDPDDYHQCIAVSATSDPTGIWYIYDFQTSTSDMNDYPKFGVWPDGYYMSVNQFFQGVSWAGAGVAVFERSAMLAGLPARMIYIDTGTVTLEYGGVLPSDLDGPAPATGTPNYFVEWDDSSWLGDPADTLRIWEFKVDWNTPANTTFGLNSNYDPNLMITTADVDPNLCGYSRNCIDQPGTPRGLDAISDRLMYRLQYRNFGSYQSLVSNHTVDANGADRAGIHWFELRNTGSGFSMYQQGVYSPDSDSRWMGSSAMDGDGNMALGYSVSGSSTYPSVRYTGRLVTDPLNTLPQGESSLVVGGGSQTSTTYRWGDYSMMAIDESDGCTFWYTQEYIATTGLAPWRTRIGSFSFPSCIPPTAITLEGTVTDSDGLPINGVAISTSTGFSTISDATGHYAISLPDGVYDVSASKYGYVTTTVPGVIVMPPGAHLDFTLETAPISSISGVVSDSLTEWPLYARIDIAGYPNSPIFTDPVTGAYSLELANGSYSISVVVLSGGYSPSIRSLELTRDETIDFSTPVDSSQCTAPGYTFSGEDCIPRASSGLVLGSVFDINTGLPILEPNVHDLELNAAVLIDNTMDPNQPHPMYIINESAGEAVLVASAPRYVADSQSVSIVENEAVRQDFSLLAGRLLADSASLEFSVLIHMPTASQPVTLSNSGGNPVNYEVFSIPGAFDGYLPVGPFAEHTRHFGPKNLNDLDASEIRMDLTPRDIPIINGGSVSASWSTGLTYAWGVGFNLDAGDLWLGDLLTAGGDGFLHRYTTDGFNTGEAIDAASWANLWNADMTYNPFTNLLWQVNVGGDNCIYELDPATKVSTGNRICPPFGTSERGLAFDPLTNTYYAGSWNDGIINHFAPDGTLIDSTAVNLSISGLAFNPGTGHLFALTSNTHPENVYDVYVLDTHDAYKILGGFFITDNGENVFADGGQAGLELDCSGNLWAVNQFSQTIYVAESGETGVCSWQSSWLSASPAQGNVLVSGSTTLNVNIDAAGLQPGKYEAYLRMVTDTPYGDLVVPVTLTVINNQFLPVINR